MQWIIGNSSDKSYFLRLEYSMHFKRGKIWEDGTPQDLITCDGIKGI